MAKIDRYTGNLKAFASEAVGTERTLFGDETGAQSDTLTANINALFRRGWGGLAAGRKPPREWFNSAHWVATQLNAYLHQAGVAEWDDGQEYYAGSVSNHAGFLWRLPSDFTGPSVGQEPGTAGAPWLTEAWIGLSHVAELATAPQADSATYAVASFYADTLQGGGFFKWDSAADKADHDGVLIIDPVRVAAWDGTHGDLATYFSAGTGSGCFVRTAFDELTPFDAGALGSPSADTESLKRIITAGSGAKKWINGLFETFACGEELLIPAQTKLKNIALDYSSSVDSQGISTTGGGLGSAQAITADITKNDKTVAVPSAGLQAGDWVLIKSTSEIWSGTVPVTEIIQVKDIPGASSINLVGGTLHNYTVAGGTTVSKMNLLEGVELHNVKMYGDGSTTLNGLRIEYCLNPRLSNVFVDRFDSSSVRIGNSVGHQIYNLQGDNCEVPGLSYSLVLVNVKNGTLRNIRGANVRHVVTYGGADGVSAGDQVFGVHGVAARAAVFDTHATARDIECHGVLSQNPNVELNENIVTTQGVNIKVTGINGGVSGGSANGVLIQPLVEYQESGLFLIHEGVVKNCNTGVLVDKPKTAISLVRVNVDVCNPSDWGVIVQTDGFDIEHLDIKSSITGVSSASFENIRLRHISATGAIKSSRIDTLSTRDNGSDSNVFLLGVAGNLIGNCVISGVLTNGLYGVLGSSVETGTVNTSAVVFKGMTTANTSGL